MRDRGGGGGGGRGRGRGREVQNNILCTYILYIYIRIAEVHDLYRVHVCFADPVHKHRCVCVCVCMCMYVCVYVCVHVCVCVSPAY